jgi:SH3-like domain-containing protein
MKADNNKRLDQLAKRITDLENENAWMKREMKSGMQSVIERMIRNKFEVDVHEKSTDDQLKELMQ